MREANEKGYNLYSNLNPLDARFQAAPFHKGKACTDADIVRLSFILIDGDAERDHPKGGKICTTDAEHEAAIRKIQVVKQFLIDQGCPPDAIVENDSGNGGALIADRPAQRAEFRPSGAAVLAGLAEEFDDADCHIDTAVGNPGRITRAPGSKNQKLSTKERPNRLCYTRFAPEKLTIAPLDFLNKIAGTAIMPAEERPDPQIDFATIPKGDRKEQIEMVIAYLGEYGVKPTGLSRNERDRFTCINLPYCLLKGEEHQTPGRAGILVYDDGHIGYHCFSAQCAEKGWAAVKKSWAVASRHSVQGDSTRRNGISTIPCGWPKSTSPARPCRTALPPLPTSSMKRTAIPTMSGNSLGRGKRMPGSARRSNGSTMPWQRF